MPILEGVIRLLLKKNPVLEIEFKEPGRGIPSLIDFENGVAAGIALFDEEGTCRYWNATIARLTDTPDERILGESLFSVFPEGRKEELEQRLEAAIAGESVNWEQTNLSVLDPAFNHPVDLELHPVRYGSESPEEGDGVLLVVLDRCPACQSGSSEANMKRFFEATLTGMGEGVLFIQNPGRIIQYCNWEGARMLGYRPEELVGETTRRLHPDEASFTAFGLESEAALKLSGSFSSEQQMRRKDGSLIQTRNTVILIHPGKGLEGGAVSIFQDQSKLKEAERSLEIREKEFQLIIENSFDWVLRIGADGEILYSCPMSRQYVGRAGKELQGKPFTDFLDRESAETLFEGMSKDWHRIVLRMNPEILDERWLECSLQRFDTDWDDGEYILIARDITERLRSEAKLRESEERFRTLIDRSKILVCQLNEEGEYRFTSRNYKEILGYDPEELLGTSAFSLIHPEELPKVEMIWREEAGQVELRLRAKNGDWVWFECWGQRMIDERTRESLIVVYSRSIQKDRLTRIERDQFFEGEQEFLCISDGDGSIKSINSFGHRLIGSREGEIRGKLLEEVVLEEDRSILRDGIDRLKVKGDLSPFTLRIVGTDGEVHWIDWTARGENDRNVIFWSGRDVTQSRRYERQIEEQARLLDFVPDAIMVRDLEDRVIYVNKGFERLFGWKDEELINQPIPETFIGDARAYHSHLKKLREHGYWEGELKKRRKDGQMVSVLTRLLLVNVEGREEQQVLVCYTDVTELENLTRQLYRAQRLESLGNLAGGVAHDLNNILAPIVLGLDFLEGRMKDERDLRSLENMKKSAGRAAKVISQLLTYARGQEGVKDLVLPKFLFEEIERIVEETFPKSITSEFRYGKDLPEIHADSTQIQQVLLNLCVNARDAMPEGGKLELSGERVKLDKTYSRLAGDALSGDYLKIEVRDDGHGIPPDQVEKIFDPFFTTKPKGKGTGLGLSTAIGIIKQHRGWIQCFSVPGEGTRFDVFLPSAKTLGIVGVNPESEDPFPEEEVSGAGEHILVTDDEELVRDAARSILVENGFRVSEARDGIEALAVLAQQKDPPIDLLLTDLVMPNMDGLQLVQVVQKIHPDLKILTASGYTSDPEKITALKNVGLGLVLQKPFTGKALLKAVEEALHGQA